MVSLNPKNFTPDTPASNAPTPIRRIGGRTPGFRIDDHHLEPVDDPDLSDAHALYIPSRDAAGDSVAITVKFPPLMVEEMKEITSSGRWPWLTDGNFIRSAVNHYLMKVQQARPPGTSYMMMIQYSNEYVKSLEYREAFEEQLTNLREQTSWFLANDPSGSMLMTELRRFRQIILDTSDQGADGVWRNRALARFYELYGAYFQDGDDDGSEL